MEAAPAPLLPHAAPHASGAPAASRWPGCWAGLAAAALVLALTIPTAAPPRTLVAAAPHARRIVRAAQARPFGAHGPRRQTTSTAASPALQTSPNTVPAVAADHEPRPPSATPRRVWQAGGGALGLLALPVLAVVVWGRRWSRGRRAGPLPATPPGATWATMGAAASPGPAEFDERGAPTKEGWARNRFQSSWHAKSAAPTAKEGEDYLYSLGQSDQNTNVTWGQNSKHVDSLFVQVCGWAVRVPVPCSGWGCRRTGRARGRCGALLQSPRRVTRGSPAP